MHEYCCENILSKILFSVVIWGLTTYVIFCCWYQAKKHKYIFGKFWIYSRAGSASGPVRGDQILGPRNPFLTVNNVIAWFFRFWIPWWQPKEFTIETKKSHQKRPTWWVRFFCTIGGSRKITKLAVYPRYTVTADTMTAERCLISGALLPLIRQSVMFGPTRCASPTPNAKRYWIDRD